MQNEEWPGAEDGGAEGIRTPDPHNAIVVLYQLSYDPIQKRRKTYGRPPPLSKQFVTAIISDSLLQPQDFPALLRDHGLMPRRVPHNFHDRLFHSGQIKQLLLGVAGNRR